MAKTTLSKARELCSASELRLVAAGAPKEIGKLDEAQLKRHVVLARKLRDKWRDQATRQTRGVQRATQARVTDDNARSREKAALFADLLARFEARLAKVAASAKATKKTCCAKKTKCECAEAAPSAAASRAARVPAAKKTAKSTKKNAARKAAKKRKVAQEKRATRAADKAALAATLPAGDAAVAPARAKQRSAATAAKGQRLKQSGIHTRVRGHVSARGKRSQSRRDSRG